MRITLEKLETDRPTNTSMFLRYLCVFLFGLFLGLFVR